MKGKYYPSFVGKVFRCTLIPGKFAQGKILPQSYPSIFQDGGVLMSGIFSSEANDNSFVDYFSHQLHQAQKFVAVMSNRALCY